MKLTIIILTHRNDQRFINALTSAQFANQVLIIDYKSNNNWNNLRKTYHFEIIEKNPPIIDWATERNSAIKIASNEWVFFLDSDEIIEKDSINIIRSIIEKNKTDGVLINRVDYFYNQPLYFGETGKTHLLRMGKKNKMSFIRPVHEIAKIDGKTSCSQISISHYAHPSINSFFESISKYTNIEADYRLSLDDETSKNKIIFQALFFPKLKFIHNYIFKLGFLDGWRGLVYSILMSLHSFFVRVHLHEKHS